MLSPIDFFSAKPKEQRKRKKRTEWIFRLRCRRHTPRLKGSLLEEASERSETSSRTDHQQRSVAVFREMEIGTSNEDREFSGLSEEEICADSFVDAPCGSLEGDHHSRDVNATRVFLCIIPVQSIQQNEREKKRKECSLAWTKRWSSTALQVGERYPRRFQREFAQRDGR
jgi:hypothetical protein